MKEFEAVFGVDPQAVQKTCLLMPMVTPDVLDELGLDALVKGKIYRVAQGDGFTLIHSLVGAGLTGDVVLHLKGTPCKRAILYGSCGLLQQTPRLECGSLVMPGQACAAESFSDLLLEPEREWRSFLPSSELLEQITEQDPDIQIARCLTVGSLKLEPTLAPRWLRRGIAIVDMECSAFLAAAQHTGLAAAALFYVSDVVQGHPLYAPLEPQLVSRISEAKGRGCAILQRFVRS